MKRGRHPRARTLAMLLVTSVVVVVPMASVIAVPRDTVAAGGPTPITEPPPVPPITPEERLPVVDLSDVSGLWPDQATTEVPGVTDAGSPDQALADASLLPADGSPTTDIYSDGASGAAHVAVVQTDDVNHETASGAWRDIKLKLNPDGKGWSWDDPSGVSTSFPADLAAASPVQIASPDYTLAISPAAGTSHGSSDGSAITYPNVFAGADLTYQTSLGGVQERIKVGEAPLSSTFDFTMASQGLALAPNAYGGIDATFGDQVVASLPAPVAYDSSADVASAVGTYTLTDNGDGTFDCSASTFLDTSVLR